MTAVNQWSIERKPYQHPAELQNDDCSNPTWSYQTPETVHPHCAATFFFPENIDNNARANGQSSARSSRGNHTHCQEDTNIRRKIASDVADDVDDLRNKQNPTPPVQIGERRPKNRHETESENSDGERQVGNHSCHSKFGLHVGWTRRQNRGPRGR